MKFGKVSLALALILIAGLLISRKQIETTPTSGSTAQSTTLSKSVNAQRSKEKSSNSKRPPQFLQDGRPRTLETGGLRYVTEIESQAWKIALVWKEKLQSSDPAQIETALTAIKQALVEGNEVDTLAALIAFPYCYELEIDKTGFRELILSHLNAKHPFTREQAFRSLYTAGPQEGDLQLVKELQHDPAMRGCLSHLLTLFTNYDLSGESGDIIASLINETADPILGRSVIGGIMSPQLSPALESALLKATYSDQKEFSHYAIYSGLSRMSPKTEPVVLRMLEMLEHPGNAHSSSRIIYGLSRSGSVPAELRPIVAETSLKLISSNQETPFQFNPTHFAKLISWAQPEHLPIIEQALQNPNLQPQLQKELKRIQADLTNQPQPQ